VGAVGPAGARGQHDDRQVLGGRDLAELLGQLVAVDARHHDVDDRQVGLLREREVEGLRAVGRQQHLVTAPLEVGGDQVAHIPGVVDDQNAEGAFVVLRHALIIGSGRMTL
jgi:hypothetical protein